LPRQRAAHDGNQSDKPEIAMPSIEALKYGLTGLAALFGFWAAAKVKAQGQALTEPGMRRINHFMIFCIALLLLSGFLALYDGYFLQGSGRLNAARQVISRMDQTIGDKLGVENDAFAPMDAHSKQIIDNMIRQLCQDVIDLSKMASSAAAPRCRARLDRPPVDAPT
jgi:hypothetical protein